MNQIRVKHRRNYIRDTISSAESVPRTSSLVAQYVSNASYWYQATADCHALHDQSSVGSDSVFEDLNTNNNAGDSTKTDDSKNTDASTEEEPLVNHCTPYLHSSVKPAKDTVFEEDYKNQLAANIISQCITTRYEPTRLRKGPSSFKLYTPGIVLVQMMLKDKVNYTEYKNTETEMSTYDVVPKSSNAFWEAMESLLALPENNSYIPISERYPYIPYSYNLPKIQLVPGFDYKFSQHTVVPKQENWRVFQYSTTNYRYKSKSYAANCRHPVSSWDEHPWCPLCLIEAGIPLCTPKHEQV